MIPKIIHYCWFGGKPLPPLAERCIASWTKWLPDYEIRRWDESNFDINAIKYTRQAYARGKYAFVSDYARFWILYKYGGIYFDTDVEVVGDMTQIIADGPFMGCENEAAPLKNPELLGVASGLGLGALPGMEIYEKFLKYYESIKFIKANGEIDSDTVVSKITRILCSEGLRNTSDIQEIAGIRIYPKVYFCPGDEERASGNYHPLTVSAHHYNASWRDQDFNRRVQNPVWRKVFGFSAWFGQSMRKLLGEKRWIYIRDRYLTDIHNFMRGTK